MLFTRPVSKLSNTITSCSPPIRRSTRCEPKNPAPPVISTRISVYLCIRQHLVGRRKRLSQPRSPALLHQAPGKRESQAPVQLPAPPRESLRVDNPDP